MKTILVIDDSEGDRYLAKRALRKALPEAQVYEYEAAYLAIDDFLDAQVFEQKYGPIPPPVLVLLDINMPRMTGFEFLEELQKAKIGQDRCVVVMMFTSSNNPTDRATADNFNLVKGYLTKPISSDQLKLISELAASY